MLGAIAGGLGTLPPSPSLLPGRCSSRCATTLYPLMAADGFEAVDGSLAGAAEALTAIGFIVGVVIFAIVTAVLEGSGSTTNAKLPLQLAQLVVGARTATADPAAMLNDSAGRSDPVRPLRGRHPARPPCRLQLRLGVDGPAVAQLIGTYIPLGDGPDTTALNRGCLNPPAIPAASPTDPHFLVTLQGGRDQRVAVDLRSPTRRPARTSTVRLSGNWFVQKANQGASRQQRADPAAELHRLVGRPAAGHAAARLRAATSSSASRPRWAAIASAIDPSTCAATGSLLEVRPHPVPRQRREEVLRIGTGSRDLHRDADVSRAHPGRHARPRSTPTASRRRTPCTPSHTPGGSRPPGAASSSRPASRPTRRWPGLLGSATPPTAAARDVHLAGAGHGAGPADRGRRSRTRRDHDVPGDRRGRRADRDR